MPKTKAQKMKILEDLRASFSAAKSCVIVSFDALNVKDDQVLRNNLKEKGVSFRVVKKTLLRKILQEFNIQTGELEKLQHNIALALAKEEITAPKLLVKFAKEHKKFIVAGGILNQNWLTSEEIKELAKLPSREDSLTKLVATISLPISGLVNNLSNNLRGLLYTLNSLKQQRSP